MVKRGSKLTRTVVRNALAKLSEGATYHCACGAMVTSVRNQTGAVVCLHPFPVCQAFERRT